jgi:hypothetical protein
VASDSRRSKDSGTFLFVCFVLVERPKLQHCVNVDFFLDVEISGMSSMTSDQDRPDDS